MIRFSTVRTLGLGLLLALGLVSCKAPLPAARPIPLGTTQAAGASALTVHLARPSGYTTQYLPVTDWEVATVELTNPTLALTPQLLSAPAVVEAGSAGRSAAFSFTALTPAAGYTVTLQLKRQDAAGVMQVISSSTETGITLTSGANTLTLTPTPTGFGRVVTPDVTPRLTGTTVLALPPEGPGARLSDPRDVAATAPGSGPVTAYVTDAGSHSIRMITQDEFGETVISTIAGDGTAGFVDGAGNTARFNAPHGIAYDGDGTLYVADTGNHSIRRLRLDDNGQWAVRTVAGDGNSGFADGVGAAGHFSSPRDVVVSTKATTPTLFVSDSGNHRIRQVVVGSDVQGNVTTIAGSGTAGFDNGVGPNAEFNDPRGLAIDARTQMPRLYVADTENHRIRSLTPISGGVGFDVSTVAGQGTAGFLDGPGAAAQFDHPQDVLFDPAALTPTLYVADGSNHRIRRVVVDGAAAAVSTLSGSGRSGLASGSAGNAQFNQPFACAPDGNGQLLVVDNGNHSLRRVALGSGDVATALAGDGRAGTRAGLVRSAPFSDPVAVATGLDGTIYAADAEGHWIWQVKRDVRGRPVITRYAGSGVAGFNEGPAATAQFDAPRALVVDAQGDVLVADSGNNRVRRIARDPLGDLVVSTVAGGATAAFSDGDAATARFNGPCGLAFGPAGRLYVADRDNHAIRLITFDPPGAVGVTTVAGDGSAAFADGDAQTAHFSAPYGLALDTAGALYVADSDNQRIRKLTFGVDDSVAVSTLAGDGNIGFLNGSGAGARFANPRAVAVDAQGRVFVADRDNHAIRLLTPAGAGLSIVSTLAGDGFPGFREGAAAGARFQWPEGMALDAAGRLVVADTGNGWLRIVVP